MKHFYSLLAAMLLTAVGLSAQNVSVNGTVYDETGEGLPGVNVIVIGTSVGTVSDFDGNFIVEAAIGQSLQLSFLGYTDMTVAITSDQRIVVNMSPDTEQLDEVVVTALGIKRSQKSQGYAITQVKADELTKGRTSDVVTGIQGKVAGVEISGTGGNPGSSQSVVIRGITSLSGNNQPLYIVDGVPINNAATNTSSLNGSFDFGNGANAINPDDVESMNVLKGSAATALYGSRASNGVIIITTKSGSGREKGFGVDFTSAWTGSTVLRYPDFQNRFGQGWTGQHWLDENGSWGPKFDGRDRLWGRVVDNSQLLKPFVPLEDNIKDFFGLGQMWQNSISIKGGQKNTSYYFSYSNVSQDGVFPTDADSYMRNTYALRGSHKAKMITISTSVNYVNQSTKAVPGGQEQNSVWDQLLQMPRDLSVIDGEDYNNKFYNVDNWYTPFGVTNPYYVLNEYERSYDSGRIFGKFELSADIGKYVNIIYRFGGDHSQETINGHDAVTIPAPGSPNDGSSTRDLGAVFENRITRYQINHDFLVSFNKDFRDNTWNLNALLGYNINERGVNSTQSSVDVLDIPGFYNLSNSSNPPVVLDTESQRRLLGLFATVEFSYNDLVYFTFNARNDWSSTLPEENRSFFYPGAAASFVFTELFDGGDAFSFGKVRVSYGQTGNDAAPYLINPVFVQSSITGNPFRSFDFPVGGQNAFEVGNLLGNPNLGPEISTEFEVGFDLRFWQNRIRLDAAYYNKESVDQIFQLPLAPSTGFTAQTLNLGNITNQGVELLFGIDVLRGDDFNWNLGFNFTKNDNEVKELSGDLDKVALGGLSTVGFVAIPGMPIGLFEGTVPQRAPDGRIVVDESGFPLPAAEKEIIGDSNIDYQMGFTTNLSWKWLNLSLAFDYRRGGDMYSATADTHYFVGNAVETQYNDRRPFVVPNSVQEVSDGVFVENTTPIEKTDINAYWNEGGAMLDETWIIDKTYLKFREASLTFTMPQKWLGITDFFTGAQFSFVGRNLYIWTSRKNSVVDPESSTFGNDLTGRFGEFKGNPTVRQFGGSVRLSF